MTSDALTRRDIIRSAGIAAAALATGAALGQAQTQGTPDSSRPTATPRPRKRALRIAHLTDMHVQPERKGGEGFAACLKHVAGQPDQPNLILSGGDTVMDSFEADHARTKLQWELWKKVLADSTNLPMEPCLGNHDIWGWNKKKSATTGSEPQYGKKWALEVFSLERPYRSFDRSGWHFIVLDGVQPDGDGYTAKLDDEQFDWLSGDLAAVPAGTPVCVLSHIPILSASVFYDGKHEKNGDWDVPGSLMHIDSRRIKNLFHQQRGKVKLCLSGHLHLVERVDYLGVAYVCNGAVSGAWWKGAHHEFEPGYALINLYDDGSFDSEYVTYGWKAAPA